MGLLVDLGVDRRDDAHPGRVLPLETLAVELARYPAAAVPYYICPQCKERSIDNDGREGFSRQAPACHHCGFGFLFELLDDYYPAPDTGFLVTDQDRRVLAIGRGVFELTGFPEGDLIGRDLIDALNFSDPKPIELAREWGVRRLGEELSIRTRSGHDKPVIADVFPAYDDDGGLLIALTPKR
jgi:PAS domain-containing protein